MQCQKLKTYMETGRVVFVPVTKIQPNPAQPRKFFTRETLEELAESIRRHGILQPLSVRRQGSNYELIAGERRLRAAVLADLTDVPCIWTAGNRASRPWWRISSGRSWISWRRPGGSPIS